MGNWGGVVAQGLAGFVSGAGKGGLDHIVEEQKIAAQKVRDAEIARLSRETHTVNAETDMRLKNEQFPTTLKQAVQTEDALRPGKIQTAKDLEGVKKYEISPGEVLVDHDGKELYVAKPREQTEAEKRYTEERITDLQEKRELRERELGIREREAGDRASDRADKAADREDKLAQKREAEANKKMPKWEKSEDDKKFAIDINSGWTREEVPGIPGKPAKEGKFGTSWGAADAVEGIPPTFIFRDENNVVQTSQQYRAKFPKLADPPGVANSGTAPTPAGPKPANAGPISPPSGWVPIGRTNDGRTIYRTPEGEKRAL